MTKTHLKTCDALALVTCREFLTTLSAFKREWEAKGGDMAEASKYRAAPTLLRDWLASPHVRQELRQHPACDKRIARINWEHVERCARSLISASLKGDPALGLFLASVREWQAG